MNLVKAIKLTALLSSSYTCGECSYETGKHIRLVQHIRLAHPEMEIPVILPIRSDPPQKPGYLYCRFCEYFRPEHQRRSMWCHLYDHTGEEIPNIDQEESSMLYSYTGYSCSFCRYTQFSKNRIEDHIRLKHVSATVCPSTLVKSRIFNMISNVGDDYDSCNEPNSSTSSVIKKSSLDEKTQSCSDKIFKQSHCTNTNLNQTLSSPTTDLFKGKTPVAKEKRKKQQESTKREKLKIEFSEKIDNFSDNQHLLHSCGKKNILLETSDFPKRNEFVVKASSSSKVSKPLNEQICKFSITKMSVKSPKEIKNEKIKPLFLTVKDSFNEKKHHLLSDTQHLKNIKISISNDIGNCSHKLSSSESKSFHTLPILSKTNNQDNTKLYSNSSLPFGIKSSSQIDLKVDMNDHRNETVASNLFEALKSSNQNSMSVFNEKSFKESTSSNSINENPVIVNKLMAHSTNSSSNGKISSNIKDPLIKSKISIISETLTEKDNIFIKDLYPIHVKSEVTSTCNLLTKNVDNCYISTIKPQETQQKTSDSKVLSYFTDKKNCFLKDKNSSKDDAQKLKQKYKTAENLKESKDANDNSTNDKMIEAPKKKDNEGSCDDISNSVENNDGISKDVVPNINSNPISSKEMSVVSKSGNNKNICTLENESIDINDPQVENVSSDISTNEPFTSMVKPIIDEVKRVNNFISISPETNTVNKTTISKKDTPSTVDLDKSKIVNNNDLNVLKTVNKDKDSFFAEIDCKSNSNVISVNIENIYNVHLSSNNTEASVSANNDDKSLSDNTGFSAVSNPENDIMVSVSNDDKNSDKKTTHVSSSISTSSCKDSSDIINIRVNEKHSWDIEADQNSCSANIVPENKSIPPSKVASNISTSNKNNNSKVCNPEHTIVSYSALDIENSFMKNASCNTNLANYNKEKLIATEIFNVDSKDCVSNETKSENPNISEISLDKNISNTIININGASDKSTNNEHIPDECLSKRQLNGNSHVFYSETLTTNENSIEMEESVKMSDNKQTLLEKNCLIFKNASDVKESSVQENSSDSRNCFLDSCKELSLNEKNNLNNKIFPFISSNISDSDKFSCLAMTAANNNSLSSSTTEVLYDKDVTDVSVLNDKNISRNLLIDSDNKMQTSNKIEKNNSFDNKNSNIDKSNNTIKNISCELLTENKNLKKSAIDCSSQTESDMSTSNIHINNSETEMFFTKNIICCNCNYICVDWLSLLRHLEIHNKKIKIELQLSDKIPEDQIDFPLYVEKAIVCCHELCFEITANSDLLKDHLVKCHKTTKNFICKHCHKDYQNVLEFCNHINFHGPELYKCKLCSFLHWIYDVVCQHTVSDHQSKEYPIEIRNVKKTETFNSSKTNSLELIENKSDISLLQKNEQTLPDENGFCIKLLNLCETAITEENHIFFKCNFCEFCSRIQYLVLRHCELKHLKSIDKNIPNLENNTGKHTNILQFCNNDANLDVISEIQNITDHTLKKKTNVNTLKRKRNEMSEREVRSSYRKIPKISSGKKSSFDKKKEFNERGLKYISFQQEKAKLLKLKERKTSVSNLQENNINNLTLNKTFKLSGIHNFENLTVPLELDKAIYMVPYNDLKRYMNLDPEVILKRL